MFTQATNLNFLKLTLRRVGYLVFWYMLGSLARKSLVDMDVPIDQ